MLTRQNTLQARSENIDEREKEALYSQIQRTRSIAIGLKLSEKNIDEFDIFEKFNSIIIFFI